VAGSTPGGPRVAVDGYELLRAVLGRRSRAQVEAWPWTAEPGAHLDLLFVFDPRDTALVE
jgi:hypothetical protein